MRTLSSFVRYPPPIGPTQPIEQASSATSIGLVRSMLATAAPLGVLGLLALLLAPAPRAGAGMPIGVIAGTASLASPPIHQWPIPYGTARKREMAAYSLRHYGEDTFVLSNPHVIVEHYTETATAQQAYDTFAPDLPDSEFHELPNTCAHFLVERSGKIDQLVPLTLRCRHTVGLNWTAIGIENIGFSDLEIIKNRKELDASLALTRWLRCTYGIALKNVIGHNESLSSSYHRERVPAFARQTHSDWNSADMHLYRTRLARLSCPVGSLAASNQ